jgi:hypothetical protein
MGSVTIAKQRFELRRDEVERALRGVLPEPIASHYVTIGPRRYPPKQVIGLVTGLDRADFTSHQARRILMGLGFPAGRRPLTPRSADPEAGGFPAEGFAYAGASSHADGDELAETLRPFRGQWVAVKGGELLVGAPTAQAVVGWLASHGLRADSMFRVPEDERALGGMAPL